MIRPTKDGVELDVLVVPRASREQIGPIHDGRIKVAVKAPPVDGAANTAVTRLLAKALGRPKSAASVTKGQTSRRKTILVAGASEERARGLIA